MQIDRLADAIKKTGNPMCAGLDTRIEHIPEDFKEKHNSGGIFSLEQAADLIYAYNRALVDAVSDIIPAVKIQIACYEMYGSSGLDAFEKTCRYAADAGLCVIADAKRNDIDSTAECYSTAFIGETPLKARTFRAFPSDFVTVNGYLGKDGIAPFLKNCKGFGRGIFVLVKTSNPSSADLQDMRVEDGRKIYEVMASMVENWGADFIGESGYSSVGAVIGATHPRQLTELRRRHPNMFFLVPGYGAQGATAKDIAGAFDKNGGGAIINTSRAVLTAWKKGGDFRDAARAELLRMKTDITGK